MTYIFGCEDLTKADLLLVDRWQQSIQIEIKARWIRFRRRVVSRLDVDRRRLIAIEEIPILLARFTVALEAVLIADGAVFANGQQQRVIRGRVGGRLRRFRSVDGHVQLLVFSIAVHRILPRLGFQQRETFTGFEIALQLAIVPEWLHIQWENSIFHTSANFRILRSGIE